MKTLTAILLHAKSFFASPLHYFSSWRHFFALGTQKERWSNPNSFSAEWDERTTIIANMIARGSSVLEFGCGNQRLVDFLPENCTYQPSDIVARSPQTLVCDLNKSFPKLEKKYDVIVFSGVLEYIADLPQLMEQVRANCGECIASYACTDQLDCIATRIRSGWINHISENAFLAIIKKADFTVVEKKTWRHQIIYKLR